ncbi:MAG: c-type cytochrome [Akkermansiaceae bacterium]
MKRLPVFFLTMASAVAPVFADSEGLPSTVLTYSNRPLGSPEEPLLLRTFMPQPGLSSEVLGRHDRGAKSPKYNAKKGSDVPGEYKPIGGLPAAIGVNYGSALSYCWDTVECRLLYAWNNGFLDMQNYWGDTKRGSRQSFGYVPNLVGTMFYKASGKHPLQIGGKSLSDLSEPAKFSGYTKKGKRIMLKYAAGGAEIVCEVSSVDAENAMSISYKLKGRGVLSYQDGLPGQTVEKISDTELVVTIRGAEIAQYAGSPNKNMLKGGVNAESGKRVFAAMACITCHSLDGSKSHGPSLLGLHGSERKIKGANKPVLADDAYILESIRKPNAKVVEGFPENYMPPYQLKKDEYQALLLYIKTLKK